MVFFAYAKNINNDTTFRYLIVFATRMVADEWWRAVSTSTNTLFKDSIKRVNSTLYTHDPTRANIASSITTAEVATGFLGKVFFTMLNDRDGRSMNVAPEDHRADHISGNTFFIRSKAAPSEYWYCPPLSDGSVQPNTPVYVSRTDRSKFVVKLTNDPLGLGSVMIGTDTVIITLVSDSLSVRVDDTTGILSIGQKPESCLTFSALANRVKAGPSKLYTTSDGRKELVKSLYMTNVGEEWELA